MRTGEDVMSSTARIWCFSRLAALALLGSLAVTLLPASAHAQPVSIGTLGGYNSYGTRINAAG